MYIALNVIIAILLVLIILVILNINSILTLLSLKKLTDENDEHVDGCVYKIDVRGGYFLEDLLKEGGVKTEEELLSFVSRKLSYGFVHLKNYGRIASCSAFSCRNKDNHVVFGRNYDYWKTGIMFVHTKPGHNRYESYSTLDMEFIGIVKGKPVKGLLDLLILLSVPYAAVDGMNEKGLAIGCLMTFQAEPEWGIPTNQNTGKDSITTTTFIRYALDYCKNVDEVVELAKKYDMHDIGKMSCHYQVADAGGNSAVLEWVYGNNKTDSDGTNRELKVTYIKDNKYLHTTNFVLSLGYYDESDESEKQGLGRYNIIKEELDSCDGVLEDDDKAMEVLSKVGCRSLDFEKNDVTVWSVVYDLTEKSATWVTNEHYGEKKYIYKRKFKK